MIIFRNELNAIITMLSWLAPSENVDGTAIDYSLSYQIYVNNTPVLIVAGTLDEASGRYQFPLADIQELQIEGAYTIELTAMPTGATPDTWEMVESDRSNAITITAVDVQRPKSPADLSGE